MKNCPYNELDWACKMLSTDGYQRMFEVGSELEAYKHESAMEITASTKTTVGACIGILYEQMYDDARRNAINEQVDKFVT